MEILKIGDRITVNCKGIKEVVNATIEGFKTLPSGKELVVITTKNGNRFPVEKKQIVKENIIKVSGKLETYKSESFNMWDEKEDRALVFQATLKSKNATIKELETLFDSLMDYMSEELDINIWNCPNVEEFENEIIYSDGFGLDYQHGDMKSIKNDIMDTWKAAKKNFNIK